jgi:hypothetical protein
MVLQLRVATNAKAERQRSKIMERTYTYQFETRQYGDEYDYDEYEYTPEDDALYYAIIECVYENYFDKIAKENKWDNETKRAIKKGLCTYTEDNDNWEELADDFKSELKEYFRDDAYEEYKDRGEM